MSSRTRLLCLGVFIVLPLAPLASLAACATGGRRGGQKHGVSAPPTSGFPAPSYVSTVSAFASAVAVVDSDEGAPIARFGHDEGVAIVPGAAGHLGAWLALGPFRLDERAPPQSTVAWRPKGIADDHALRPEIGVAIPTMIDVVVRDPPQKKEDGTPGKFKRWTTAPAAWKAVASGEGAIDLEKVFGSNGRPAVGYLGGVLRLPAAAKLLLIVGSDDGCEVIVDGRTSFVRDASRPQRNDDDLVPLDLAAGDHTVLFKLHQRDGGWAIRVRLVDETLRPPRGVRLLLPKAADADAAELARTMSWVRLMREPKADGYAIRALVRYPEGAPTGVLLAANGAVLAADGSARVPERALGVVPIGVRAVGELSAVIGDAAAEGSRELLNLLSLLNDEVGEKDLTVRVEIAGRVVEGAFHPRATVRTAIAAARATLARWEKSGRPAAIPEDVAATLEHLADRLDAFVTRGDPDVASQLADAGSLAEFVADADAGADPIGSRTGAMRVAHFARADGRPQPIGVFVPQSLPSAKPGKKYPLYVGLHGMNGGPMAMIRVFFGGDDDKKTQYELDRTLNGRTLNGVAAKNGFEGFVLAPHGHGNAMYRHLGEEEVMEALAWAFARFPQIDRERVYVTGYSMGGIAAASIPLHHPDVFAAAQSLCGYHSYFIRRDVAGRPRRPWEQILIEERSNVSWAENGARLPLYVVHGAHDLPEENSAVLVDAYEKLGFPIKHEHPDLGHDVWGWAYAGFDHVKWFGARKRGAHPRHVRLKTTRPRFGDDAWLHVDRLATAGGWGEIDASIVDPTRVRVSTKNVDGFHLDRPPELFGSGTIAVTVDGRKLDFVAGAPLVAHRGARGWTAGAPPPGDPRSPRKEGRITGPIRDVFSEPLIVVYGADDPAQTTANLEVAQSLASIRWGTDVRYPLLKDSDVDPAAAPGRSMIVVGNARSNRVTRALEKDLPMTVEGDSITFAGRRFTGAQLGAAFIVPHPNDPTRYLVVVEGTSALGTWRAMSLPELLPDFVIWDERLAPARGQTLLSFGAVQAAGFFDVHWNAPAQLDDPLLARILPGAKSEKDATAYLP